MCYPRLLGVGRQGDNRLFPRYVRVVSDFRPLATACCGGDARQEGREIGSDLHDC